MPISRKHWSWPAGVALLALAAGACPLAAHEQPALTIKSARVGVGGRCKAGFWAPIWLDLAAGPGGARGKLEIVVPDGDFVPATFTDDSAGELNLQSGQEISVLRYAKIGPLTAPLKIQLRDGERLVWSQVLTGLPTRLAATQELVLGIGPSVGLDKAIANIRRPAEVAFFAAQIDKAADLPDRWWGYEGVDAIVLTTSDQRLLAALTPDQREAIIQWVRLGGRLVLCAGSGGESLLAADSPWAILAPGKLAEVSPLRERGGLEAFGGAELPWNEPEFQQNRPRVTRLTDFDGVVLVDELAGGSNRPLIVRSAHALGEVIFVGLDLDHAGLAKWSGRPRLLANLLTAGRGRVEEDDTGGRRGVGYLGYRDLVGQLRAALDQFAGVALVNFTTVSVLTVGYLLLIGPADYALMTWLNLPRQVTWVTFALVAISFGAIAWYLGREAHGERVRLNQVEIVDLDARQGVVRGTVWAHLYSPTNARFTAEPAVTPEPVGATHTQAWLAWQGLPGDSLGGLHSQQTPLAVADGYRILPPGRSPGIVDLPVQSASSKALSVRWWGERTMPAPSDLWRNQFGSLAGELTNPFACPLTECLLVYDDRLYRVPGTLEAGQTLHVADLTPLHLEARLTERTVVQDKDVTTQWRQDSTDIPRIVQMMMLHDAARGQNYTGLTHRYQPYIDLSGHLKLNRAVLSGRAAEPATRLESAGQPLAAAGDVAALTWCRVVFPVLPQPKETSRP